jgi:hypothetical protein
MTAKPQTEADLVVLQHSEDAPEAERGLDESGGTAQPQGEALQETREQEEAQVNKMSSRISACPDATSSLQLETAVLKT